jgi:hypothetical protein
VTLLLKTLALLGVIVTTFAGRDMPLLLLFNLIAMVLSSAALSASLAPVRRWLPKNSLVPTYLESTVITGGILIGLFIALIIATVIVPGSFIEPALLAISLLGLVFLICCAMSWIALCSTIVEALRIAKSNGL